MGNILKAYIAITFKSLITGFSFIILKIALDNVDTIDLLAHRFTLAAISVFLFTLIQGDNIRIDIKDFLKIAPYSIIYPIIFFLFQTWGMKESSSSEAAIVYALVPILTLIVARVLINEQINKLRILFIIISIGGVIFINFMNGLNLKGYNFFGFILILVSAISVAVYNVLIKSLTKTYSSFTIVSVMSYMGFLTFNIICIIQHWLEGNLNTYLNPYKNPSFVIAIFYLGIISSLITNLLTVYALRNLEASKVGLFNNVSTMISILAGIIFLKEPFYFYHCIGIGSVIIGTIGFNWPKAINSC